MEGHEILVELWGVKWTLPLIVSAVFGFVTFCGTIYKIVERWMTREQRKLALLHEYLDKEEHDITSKRREVLTGIQLSHHAYLTDQKLDVGREIDSAVRYLDSGRPDRAEARLRELRKKIQQSSNLLARRVDDLRKHERSVNIFLAAVSERDDKTIVGLDYIQEALDSDGFDLDALRYKGYLHLKRQELDPAEKAFQKILNNNDGSSAYRAEAYLGLGTVSVKRGIAGFEAAAQALKNSLTNSSQLAPSDQNPHTKASAHQMLANIYGDEQWGGCDNQQAADHYRKALAALKLLPQGNATVAKWTREIGNALWLLENPRTLGAGGNQPTQPHSNP